MRTAASRHGNSSALTKNPDRSGSWMTTLPSRSATKERARVTVSVAVVSAGITSTSFSTGTRSMKCRPTTWAELTHHVECVAILEPAAKDP